MRAGLIGTLPPLGRITGDAQRAPQGRDGDIGH
jgi:hypothetical protein